MDAQLDSLLTQRTALHARHDVLLLERDTLVARRQEVLALRTEIHTQIRNKTPSQSVIERAHLRVRSHRTGEEIQEIDAKMREVQEREKVQIQELEELDDQIEESYKQLGKCCVASG